MLTDKGYKDISQIEVGNMVLTHTGEYHKVIRTNHRVAETISVKAMGYPEFITTENHPFYTVTRYRNKRKENKSLIREFTDPCWTEVKDLTTDHFLGQLISPKENKIIETNFSLEDYWLLGRYIADGHVRKNKRSGRKNSYQYQFIISVGDSKLEDFKSKITERHYVCFQHSQSTHRCVFCSMELVNFIIDNDFGRSASTKRIPEFIYSLPYEYKKEFLMGYLSGDGFYDNNKNNWNASTVSKELAFDIQRLATQIFETNVTVSCVGKRKDGHRINGRLIKSNFDTYTITIPTEIKSQSKAYINNNIVWTQVKKVENTGNKKVVYNIEVETDNSYTVNNCIVHNCTFWSMANAGKKNNPVETTASGIGWNLFSHYVRIKNEVQPKWFLYENNANISDEIKKNISEKLGVEPILIDSADFSAQKRLRLYWTNIPVLPWTPNPITFADIMDSEYELSRSIEQYKDTIIWSKDKMQVKWDTSGKGYYSQQNRAKLPNQKWSTVCASRAECKGNVWLGDYMIRSVTISELEKLQTLPVGYTSCLKNKELRGRGIGNGWTCDLIAHIFKGLKQEEI